MLEIRIIAPSFHTRLRNKNEEVIACILFQEIEVNIQFMNLFLIHSRLANTGKALWMSSSRDVRQFLFTPCTLRMGAYANFF